MRRLYLKCFWFAYWCLPGVRPACIRAAKVGNWSDKRLAMRLLRRSFFEGVYPRLNPEERQSVQRKLMGDDEGAFWAQHHESLGDVSRTSPADIPSFPPVPGTGRVGRLDFLEAFPLFNYLDAYLKDKHSVHVIQLGTCSGKEIAWFSKRFPALSFTGTDIYDSAISEADSNHRSPNLRFLQAAADNLHLIAAAVSEPEVLIFTSGAALYIFPEVMPAFFGRLAALRKTVHVLVCEPNSRSLLSESTGNVLSRPASNMGYDHNYRLYATAVGFDVVHEATRFPYEGPGFPAHMTDRVINFLHLVRPVG